MIELQPKYTEMLQKEARLFEQINGRTPTDAEAANMYRRWQAEQLLDPEYRATLEPTDRETVELELEWLRSREKFQ